MAISRIGAGASDNWELITSVTPTASSATVNLTSIPSRRKLMLVLKNVQTNVSSNVTIRVNNDSGTNAYQIGTLDYTSGVFSGTFFATDGYIRLTNGLASTFYAYLILSSCDNAGVKIIENGGTTAGGVNPQINGVYFGSAVVSELNVSTTSTFKALGTIEVYGAR